MVHGKEIILVIAAQILMKVFFQVPIVVKQREKTVGNSNNGKQKSPNGGFLVNARNSIIIFSKVGDS